jgi:hypothetical protein
MAQQKHKKLLILMICIISIVFISFYRKRISQYVSNYKFELIIKNAIKTPSTDWDNKYKEVQIKNKYKVVFVASKGGEQNYVEYFKYAAERNGWEVKVYLKNINSKDQEILNFNPDFILLSPFIDSDINDYIMAHKSKKYILNLALLLQLENPLKLYNGDIKDKNIFLLSNAVCSLPKEINFFVNQSSKLNKPFYGLELLPSAPAMVNEPAEPRKLMWAGGIGEGMYISSDRYRNFTRYLSESIPMKVYGKYLNFNYFASHVYDGFLPFGIEQINAIRKNGIYLLTHSDNHIKAALPSLRIFEATAANAVVISDMHPFAIEHFGDSFLYFDQTADAETMYKQVKAHYDWIKANPKKAKAMAAKAHKIFLEKFTLDKDLDRIARMHEYVVKQEKDMGLSYPLAY